MYTLLRIICIPLNIKNKLLRTEKLIDKEARIFDKLKSIMFWKFFTSIHVTCWLIAALIYLSNPLLWSKAGLKETAAFLSLLTISIISFIVFLILTMKEYFLGMKICLIDSDFNKIAKPILIFNLISAFILPFIYLFSNYLLEAIISDQKINIEQKFKDYIKKQTDQAIETQNLNNLNIK